MNSKVRNAFLALGDAAKVQARKRLIAVAADARKEIQRSLKSGGKNRYSKTYRSSKPGEPPLTHGGALKRSIRYEVQKDDKIIVGAPSVAGSKTAKTLERGGVGAITETTFDAGYFALRRKRARAAKAAGVQKPELARAHTMRSEDGKTRRVRTYERFSSKEAAQNAASAPEFQAWRGRVQKTTVTRVDVKPRPFVAPGVKVAIRKGPRNG